MSTNETNQSKVYNGKELFYDIIEIFFCVCAYWLRICLDRMASQF